MSAEERTSRPCCALVSLRSLQITNTYLHTHSDITPAHRELHTAAGSRSIIRGLSRPSSIAICLVCQTTFWIELLMVCAYFWTNKQYMHMMYVHSDEKWLQMALFFLAFGEKLSTQFLLLTVATMLNTAQAKISRDPCAKQICVIVLLW